MKRDWFQIVANLGVMIGLIVLIYEVNQANKHVSAQLVDSNFQMGYQGNLSLLGENPATVLAKALEDPSTLDQEERIILDAYHQSVFIELEHRWYLSSVGIFGEQWKSGALGFARVLAYPAGSEWWSRRRGVAPIELREIIDEAITQESNWLNRIQPYSTNKSKDFTTSN